MTNESSTLADYLRIVRRRKWIIVAACVLVPLVAVLLALRADERHVAEARVAIDQGTLQQRLDGDAETLGLDQQVQLLTREAQVARSSLVEQAAQRNVARYLGGAELADITRVEVAEDTGLLLFVAESPVPSFAAAIADGYASAYLEYRGELNQADYREALRQLDAKLATLDSPEEQDGPLFRALSDQRDRVEAQQALVSSGGTVLAVSEPEPVGASPVRNAVLGLALGLIVGLIVAFVADALDRRTSSLEHVEEAMELPQLAEIPDLRGRDRADGLFAMRTAPLSPTAEAYRSLRASVELALASHATPALLVTSATEGEGKTVTACNLAAAFALSGAFVTLVDLDLRRPNAHRVMGVARAPGVGEIAAGDATIADATVTVDLAEAVLDIGQGWSRSTANAPLLEERAPMRFLPAGEVPANVGDFVGTLDVSRLLDALRNDSDIVIIDAPPLLGGGDGLVLSSYVDAVLLVARLGVSDRRGLQEIRRKLALSPSTTIGYVVTAVNRDPEHPDIHYGVNGRAERSSRILRR